jgi:hypothetical protein
MATVDIFGEPLTYSGKAPKPARLINSSCGTFNGVSDYIDTGVAFSPSGDYEVSGWFFSGSTVASIDTIFDGRDGGSDGVYIFQLANTLLGFYHNATTSVSLSTNIGDDKWHRFVANKTGSTLTLSLYDVAGNLEESDTATNATAIATTTSVKIGSNFGGSGNFFQGQLANIKAVDGTTTVFHYPMAEGAGLTAFDISGNGNHGVITATEAAFWAS